MTFDKYFLNNRAEDGSHLSDADKQSPYARALYWISFPFDVKLSEVFGFGEYGDYWIMEYYDGEARAKNGLWADTDTYWKYIPTKTIYSKKVKDTSSVLTSTRWDMNPISLTILMKLVSTSHLMVHWVLSQVFQPTMMLQRMNVPLIAKTEYTKFTTPTGMSLVYQDLRI
jgi:hypothetical protein